jgi:hypothetical protein
MGATAFSDRCDRKEKACKSEESIYALWRGLEKIEEDAGMAWLREHLERTVSPLLKAPWILDVDTTVKLLYGKQEGAVVGYNPKKPGAAFAHLPPYRVAGLRLVSDAEVLAGNEADSNHTLPSLLRFVTPHSLQSPTPFVVPKSFRMSERTFIL